MPKTPGYRKRHDRNQAIVTLTDAVTKWRRDYWLGEPGSPQSREMYHRVIAEWEANDGRRLFDADFDKSAGGDGEHGLEASALVLGHASARVTDAVYAERDQSKVVEIMQLVG